ncbi:MAG: type I-D CRISPR-associated protein Cas7/Csc2, partial [Pseudanabaena sp. ELA748]
MTFLKSIESKFFHSEIPYKPMGKYVHFLTVRVTESYPLFQTDGELNKARVSAGLKDRTTISRLAMFKRKQSTPERLVGRELLRNYGFMTAEECEYNVKFAMNNSDCIIYGFAIGDSGSEKSKVVVDTAFSITPFDESHETFTLNAPYENGTMASKGEVGSEVGKITSRINQQDHIRPQVFFPSIVTLKDPTEAGFLYVFNNILRTRHYGAQTTRTGRVRNELIGVVFADGEITSNLQWTQAIYDLIPTDVLQSIDPLSEDIIFGNTEHQEIGKAEEAILTLLNDEPIVHQDFIGANFAALLKEVKALTTSEEGIKSILQKADDEAKAYAAVHI